MSTRRSRTEQQLLDLLGIELPIVQAPMAGVSTPAMAAAVSNAGGLGSLSVGAMDAHGAQAALEAVRALSDRPFNVNLFCHEPAIADPALEQRWIERLRPAFLEFGAEPPPALTEIYRSFLDDEDMLALLLRERPPVVSFHFGLPARSWVAALRQAGVVLIATATNLAEARAAEASGVHAVVAQGWEAGGHRGIFDPNGADGRLRRGRLTAVLSRSIGLPIIAAGGLMHGRDIAAALGEGAGAAQLGTAFLATDESLADAGYRAALVATAPDETVMARTLSGRPARGLPTRFTELTEQVPPDDVPAYPLAYGLAKILDAAARAQGVTDFRARWAGEGASQVRAFPAGELVARLAVELEAAR